VNFPCTYITVKISV